jgi:hypothetical protein
MKRNIYTLLLIAIIPFAANAQQLKINEIMASNATNLASELGNFGDWIELYNPTTNNIDLTGLYITDDITMPTKYQFPVGTSNAIIAPNGFKLIWADDSSQALHTNFKLSSAGETIAIFAADGTTLLDSISYGAQTTDISFGRTTDGGNIWATFTSPTPDASNDPTTLNNEINNTNSILIYPNPANEEIYVVGKNWNLVQVIDITGKIILSETTNYLSQQVINISNLNKGVYLLQVVTNSVIYNERLIKY